MDNLEKMKKAVKVLKVLVPIGRMMVPFLVFPLGYLATKMTFSNPFWFILLFIGPAILFGVVPYEIQSILQRKIREAERNDSSAEYVTDFSGIPSQEIYSGAYSAAMPAQNTSRKIQLDSKYSNTHKPYNAREAKRNMMIMKAVACLFIAMSVSALIFLGDELETGGKACFLIFGGGGLLMLFLKQRRPQSTATGSAINDADYKLNKSAIPVKLADDCVQCDDENAFSPQPEQHISTSYDYGMQQRRDEHEYEHQLKQLENQYKSGLITKEEYKELKARYKS